MDDHKKSMKNLLFNLVLNLTSISCLLLVATVFAVILNFITG